MTGKEMREEFAKMLGRKNETLSYFLSCAKSGELGCREAAEHTAYEISGIVYAAYRLGVMDLDEMESIQRAAQDAARGKVFEDEAC